MTPGNMLYCGGTPTLQARFPAGLLLLKAVSVKSVKFG